MSADVAEREATQTPNRMALSTRTATWSLAAVVVTGVTLQLHNLGHEDLTFFDEFFHATVARNLLKHPLLFTLYDTPSVALIDGWYTAHVWLHKPPLAMWQITLSYWALGTTTFALRLPSVLLCAGLALITYRLATELFRSRGVGLLA